MLGDLLSGIADLVVDALNALIAAFAVVLEALFAILPDMPELPEPPDALITAESWVAWFFPVGTLIDVLVFTLSMYLLWQAVALALRWAKMLND